MEGGSGEVALPRIFVIDDSEAVRETLSIVLAHAGEVHEVAPHDCSASYPVPDARPDLIIANADTIPAVALSAIGAANLPVIWLRARPQDGAPVRASTGPSIVLPARFDGHDLTEHVRQLLRRAPQSQPQPTGDKLAYPYLSHEAAQVAHEAAANRLPVLISGEPGTGRARVATAIQAAHSATRLVPMPPASCTRNAMQDLAATGSEVSILIDDVASATAETQALLLEVVDAGGLWTPRGWLAIRIMAATAADLGSMTYGSSFSHDLYYRLNVLPITLPPLRERPQDIPVLARAIAAELCSNLGCRPVAFTPRAMQRLTRYLWFGNIAELETVLARTIALAHKEVLDVGDLLFGYGPLIVAPASLPVQPEQSATPLATSAVDMIINELAHEFKNPLVTLKTFAQHLDRLVLEESSRDQLVLMTGEAVDRIDRALENLLQFTRFHEPSPQPVPLGAILGPVLAELGPLLSERRLMLDYRPPHSNIVVNVDPEQITYALENLLRALIRNVGDGGSIAVHCGEGGHMTIQLPAGNGRGIAKLASLLPPRDGNEESPLPLGLALARSLVKRNGGQFEIQERETGATVTIQLSGADGVGRVVRDDGTTTAANR
jgi:DNA-binding NtrC family response regulator